MGFLMEASPPVDGVCEGTLSGGREGVSFRGTGG